MTTEQDVERVAFEKHEVNKHGTAPTRRGNNYITPEATQRWMDWQSAWKAALSAMPNKHENGDSIEVLQEEIECLETEKNQLEDENESLLAKVDKHEKALQVLREAVSEAISKLRQQPERSDKGHNILVQALATVEEMMGANSECHTLDT